MKPGIVIVDENDNTIGQKAREDVRSEDIYRVAALWITNPSGQILLAQRALTKSHDPGKWGPAVAGTVEDGEDYQTNIIKEAEEEIGVKNIQTRLGPKDRIRGKHTVFVQWFFLEIDKPAQDFSVQKEEVEQVRWFAKGYLIKDVDDYPEKYLPRMPQIIEKFLNF